MKLKDVCLRFNHLSLPCYDVWTDRHSGIECYGWTDGDALAYSVMDRQRHFGIKCYGQTKTFWHIVLRTDKDTLAKSVTYGQGQSGINNPPLWSGTNKHIVKNVTLKL